MAKQKDAQKRKTFAVRLDRDLMRMLQHVALDEDKFASDLLDEAIQDLLKKYREKRREAR